MAECSGLLHRGKATRNFLFQLDHAQIALGQFPERCIEQVDHGFSALCDFDNVNVQQTLSLSNTHFSEMDH
jgi:hypothetical protein